MFRGCSFHTLDPKGRVIIPARFRDAIWSSGSNGVMLARMDKSLFAYTYDVWSKIENKILSLSEKSDHMRRFRRVFVGGAFDCACDKQNRILIPPALRLYAELEKDIVLVGVLDHFEIWSQKNWEAENMELEKSMKQEDVRNEIAKLGL